MRSIGEPVVDLRSDTVTRPDAAMRQAIASAEVGDHLLGDDPTAAELERFAAEMLGKERALYFPSGVMANTTAIIVQTRPGDEVLIDHGGHILRYEEGSAAAFAGVQMRALPSDDGLPDPATLSDAINRTLRYRPFTSLLCLENTHNAAGGRVFTPERVKEVTLVAREHGVSIHLDGARLPNASAATGRSMREWAALADTVMVSLSKALGAPIGSILAGPADLIDAAWRVRRRLGGGMRQAGIIAAAGLYALRNNFDRIPDDHRRAARLADAIATLPGLRVTPPESNIIMIDVHPQAGDATELISALGRQGVLTTLFGPGRIRAVTHRDVDDAGIDRAIAAFRAVATR